MPGLLQNIIVRVDPNPASHTVRLEWRDGSVSLADFGPLLGRGVYRALSDPAVFARAEILDGGHVLAWPGDLEFDADALWFEAHPEDSPATAPPRAAGVPA